MNQLTQPAGISYGAETGISNATEIGARFALAAQIADALQYATLIPDHLRGERKRVNNVWQLVPYEPQQVRANVIMVCNRALQWNVDPVALIAESFVVGGKLDFQGKVIIAVVNRLAGLRSNLQFDYHGSGEDRTVVVSGELKSDGGELRTAELSFRQAATYKDGKLNEQWTKDVDQKLAYSGAKKWARLHTPEVVLGLFADEEDAPPPEPRQATIDASSRQAATQPAPNVQPNAQQPAAPSAGTREQVFYGYSDRIRAATTQEEVQRLIDKLGAEPAEVISAADRDSLRSLARGRWKDLGAADEGDA